MAAVVNGQVILNVGKKAGIKPGDQFTVQHGTQVIKDPATGAVLRTLSTKVGVIQAADVDDVFSGVQRRLRRGLQGGRLD